MLSFFNIVVEDCLALSSCDSGDDGDDSDDGCAEYLEGNYRDDNGDDVYVHGRKNRVGDPFADLLEHSFLVSLIFSFRLIILYLMPMHD